MQPWFATRAWAAALALLGLVVAGCSCTSSPPPPPAATGAARPAPSAPAEPPEDEPAPALWRKAISLVERDGLEPRVAARLRDLERDYFDRQFAYVTQEAQDLLDMAGDDPKMRLRLYYLLARAHARNRQPTEASRYERLFRELYLKLRDDPPRAAAARPQVRGLVERSEELYQDIHPAWNQDADGVMWANVRVFRELDRAGPHATITREHPGGGVIHAGMNRDELVAYLGDLGMWDPEKTVLQRDQRYGFFYWIEEKS